VNPSLFQTQESGTAPALHHRFCPRWSIPFFRFPGAFLFPPDVHPFDFSLTLQTRRYPFLWGDHGWVGSFSWNKQRLQFLTPSQPLFFYQAEYFSDFSSSPFLLLCESLHFCILYRVRTCIFLLPTLTRHVRSVIFFSRIFFSPSFFPPLLSPPRL